ncbi:MAG: replication initiator [Ferrimicrobium sp.]
MLKTYVKNEPTVEQIAERIGESSWPSFAIAARTSGNCSHPVHLGHATCESLEVELQQQAVKDGRTYVGSYSMACGSRRESVCPSCSRVYKKDASELIKCGLVGGKGQPEGFANHPQFFFTLTAPSFGPVHHVVVRNGVLAICHGGNSMAVCVHGRRLTCFKRHLDSDTQVGAPLCADCQPRTAMVAWNGTVGGLWARTRNYINRQLEMQFDLARGELSDYARLEYVKVAEFQARGLVHLHVVLRIDDGQDRSMQPTLALTAETVEKAVRAAAAKTVLERLDDLGEIQQITWGVQLDFRQIYDDSRQKIVNYVAKYATKSAAAGGSFDHQFEDVDDIKSALGPEHLKALARTAFEMAEVDAYADLKSDRWAHDLGFRGHFLSKSRRYSITFKALRSIRQDFRREQAQQAQAEGLFSTFEANLVFVPGQRFRRLASGWFASDTNHRRIDDYLVRVWQQEAEEMRLREVQERIDERERELELTG